jgi:small subunit ribosomal protein S17
MAKADDSKKPAAKAPAAKPAAAKAKPAAKPAAAKAKPAAKAKAAPVAAAPVAKPAPKPAKPKKERVRREAGATPAIERSQRKTRIGVVASNKMERTVVVAIERRVQHPIYGKVVLRSNKFKAHDEMSCDIGDKVEIMETRPMSREKRWRVIRIVEKVK